MTFMDDNTINILIVSLALCGPFILSFLIVAILSPRFKALSEKNGWTVQPHPEDHRDHLFKGQQNSIQWEMEYYRYDHYQKPPPRSLPYIQVIAWTTNSVRLPKNTLLIYPRRDKLKHIAHPRLVLEDNDFLTNPVEKEKMNNIISDLPEKLIGTDEFRKLFVLRTELEVLPRDLLTSLQLELSSWTKIQLVGPVILINGSGVTIWWIPIGMRNEWLEKTVSLGTNLAGCL
jgi:hypothetical protein